MTLASAISSPGPTPRWVPPTTLSPPGPTRLAALAPASTPPPSPKLAPPPDRDELVKDHLRLVWRLARKFQHFSISRDDLLQAGNLGLIKAAANFDPENGAEFSTFATHWILGEIKHCLRDSSWHLKVPRTLKEDRHQLGQAIHGLTSSLGRSPTVPELARELATTEERVIELTELGGAASPASLDEHFLLDDRNTEELYVTKLAVDRAKQTLPEREQQILDLRFRLGMSQTEISRSLNLSQMHISRLLRRSLETMRRALQLDPKPSLGEARQ